MKKKKSQHKFDYSPDRWTVIKITPIAEDVPHYRVFGTWGGSYLHGQSWKMNSGITSVTEDDDYFYFTGSSGSVYRCNKDPGSYGYFSYGMSVLSSIIEESRERLTITEMPGDTNWKELDYGSK